jgi:MoaA/NifB/PqqE/SkfB family radical SAM enzyme
LVSRFIDPRSKPFAHLDRLAGWQRGEKPAPVTIEWDLSNRCVYGCQDCHFAHTHTKGPLTRTNRILPMAHDKGGDLADTPLVMRVLREAKAAGVQGIVWTGGGEPTTHPEFFNIFANADYAGLKQGMYTLGALLGPAQSAWIRDHFEWVVISLDASTPEQYAAEKRTPQNNFARACQAVQWLSGGQCKVGVSFLLHERNFMLAADMVEIGRSLGATYTTLRPTIRTQPDAPGVPVGDRAWVAQAMPMLEQLAKQPDVEVDPARFEEWAAWTAHPYATCYGIRMNATITPDGRLWVCPNRREYAGASCVGDLKTESFADVWARHPGKWMVDADCRASCRLHSVNQTLAEVFKERQHGSFI